MRSIIPGLLVLVWAATGWTAESLQVGPPSPWVHPTPLPAPGVATQAAVQILLLDHQLKLSPKTVSYYTESIVRIQTPEGLSAAGTVKLQWNPDTDVLVVHKIHILRGNKVIDVLGSGQTFTVARREANLDYAAIDGTLTAILEPADLEVGDTLDLAYTVERTDPILEGTSEAEEEISPALSVMTAHLSALWPASDPVKWQVTQGLAGVHPIRTNGLSGIDLTMRDLQPIVQPKGAPLRFLLDRRADFSSFGSWAEVAQRLAPLYEHAASLSPAAPLQAEIATIRAASTDPKVRAAMALSLVEDKVRYVFLGMNDGGLVPASADQTWSRRYGDCKAKTVLLLALLHNLGIDAQPVAVNVFGGDGLDGRLPMIELFDHVLVQSVIDGKTYWLDGTRMGDTNLDRLHEPFYHWELPLVSTGAKLTKLLPPAPSDPTIEETVEIDAGAGVAVPAPIHLQTEFHGEAGVALRMRLDNLTSTQLDTGLRAFWSPQAGNVKIRSVAAAYDTQSAAERLTMDGTVTMDWSSGEHDIGLLGIGYKADFKRDPGPNQNAPFAVAYPLYVRTTEVMKLPAGGKGFSVVGSDVDVTLAGTEYRRHASVDGAKFTATTSTRSVVPEFPASEAAADQESLSKLASTQVGIKAPTGHTPTEAEIAWGLPSSNNDAGDYASSGWQLWERREADPAIADFNAALALDAHNGFALGGRGLISFWMGDYTLARADFDAALAAHPDNWVALNGRGLLAAREGDQADAIAAFSAAMRSNSKDAFALPYLAQAYWRIGKRDLAAADFGEAIRNYPSRIELYQWRALVFAQEGKKLEAIHQAQLVTKANPKSPRAYLSAGWIYEYLHERRDASAAFDRAVAVAPVAQTYLMRASYRPWTDLSGKRADVESALKLDAESVPALVMLAELQSAVGHYREATSTLNRAMRRQSETPRLLALRGIAYQKSGESALAEQDLAKARQRSPEPDELNSLCWRLATAGVSLASALEDCKSAVAKDPQQPAFQDSLGFVLLRLQRYAPAIAAYDAALKINSLDPNSLYGRGICELREGDTRAANRDIDAAKMMSYLVAAEFAHYGVNP